MGLNTGTVLSGRYRLEAPLGTGATAAVWRARDVDLGRLVAVKLLHTTGVDPELAARFTREGRILGRLNHPNIVPVLARGPGRRPAGLRLADAVFGAMVRAGWPPAQATSIGALMRYFIMGSALGSFAGGFVDDESAYDPADYPHLGQAHLLAEQQEKIDERAFETGLGALLDGLAVQYAGLVRED